MNSILSFNLFGNTTVIGGVGDDWRGDLDEHLMCGNSLSETRDNVQLRHCRISDCFPKKPIETTSLKLEMSHLSDSSRLRIAKI